MKIVELGNSLLDCKPPQPCSCKGLDIVETRVEEVKKLLFYLMMAETRGEVAPGHLPRFFSSQCKEGERLWFAEGQLLFLSEFVEKLLVGFAEISPDKEQNKVYNSV